MIDLSLMRGIHIDRDRRIARVQPGLNWGDLDRETQRYGLAVPGGIVSATGVAGLTLGGGFGWLSRKHGLTSDNLLSVDVVLADGRLVKASSKENPELFWGIRGGGGNFGIVTLFEFQLQPIGPEVMAGLILYPFADAREVLEFYREFTANAPDELGTLAVLRIAPRLLSYQRRSTASRWWVLAYATRAPLRKVKRLCVHSGSLARRWLIWSAPSPSRLTRRCLTRLRLPAVAIIGSRSIYLN